MVFNATDASVLDRAIAFWDASSFSSGPHLFPPFEPFAAVFRLAWPSEAAGYLSPGY
jgi:hypothetical protein